jgi:glycerol uptake facilitator protein
VRVSIWGAETIGTAILILLGDGVVAGVLLNHSKAQNGGWIVVTFGWGMAVAMAVFAVAQFSGAHLNPAVTLGFAVAPLMGGVLAALAFNAFYPG